jgi:hypothetical protein
MCDVDWPLLVGLLTALGSCGTAIATWAINEGGLSPVAYDYRTGI